MAFSKITAVSMGTGAAGVGSVGIVGWQLLSSGIFSSTPNYSLNDVVLDSKLTGIDFKYYGCFKKMFPGVSIDQKKTSENVDDVGSLSLPSSSVSVKSNPVGCMVMKMHHDLNRSKWVLSGEVVLKSDNVSWVVWAKGFGKLADGATQSSDFQQSLEYRLVLLEKKGDGDSWSVKTGYSWKDQGISVSDSYYDLKIYVSVPGEQEWINENRSNDDIQKLMDKEIALSSPPSNHEYSGIWEYTGGNEDLDAFRGIKISDEKGNEGEIFGRKNDFSIKIASDYSSEGKIYVANDNKWKSYTGTDAVDLSENLNSWYKPFKGKKGKWKPLANYCSETNESKQLENVCDVNK